MSLFLIAPVTDPCRNTRNLANQIAAHQSNPGLLGHARAPVQLNQNQNNWTARAGAGRTELASQSEAARATRLFATEQSGINGARLYSEAVQENRGNTGGVQGDVQE